MEDNSKQKPKILYVITQGEWGGAQRYVYDLATNLKDDFEVLLAVGEKKGKKDLQNKVLNPKPLPTGQAGATLNKSKIQIIQLKHLRRNISIIHDILAVFELAKLYRTLKPDIVHLNSSKAGTIGSLAKSLTKLDSRFHGNDKMEVIYTVHGWVFNEPRRKVGRWLYRFLERMTARWKDKIIVLSDKDLADGVELGIDKKKLVNIPLGIEMPRFLEREEARRQIARLSHCPIVNTNKIWVGTIANLYKTKGLDVLIETVNLLKRDSSASLRSARNDSVRFVVIGEGPERENLESRIMNYELGDTIFLTGTIDNASQYLPAFDLFVLPSRKEGLPYTLLEAMAQGTPIIATNTGGVSSLIKDKENGILVEPENSQQLSNALSWAIKNYREMKKRAERASGDVKLLTIGKMTCLTKITYFHHLPVEESMK
ncbi:MAG: glycosyltransferase family 4 protein [Candidatus Magasanikbacteria bacterium]|nr:glycosyltransferase family 4 protein [Candidatus Magasanikbacteria bacterium]